MKDKIAIMSIKYKYLNEILNNNKQWEFRKFKINNYDKILIYVGKPINNIVLLLNIDYFIADKPENIWSVCKNEAGISKEEYFEYFKNKKIAYAYKIKNYEKININIKDLGIIPPATIKYINTTL